MVILWVSYVLQTGVVHPIPNTGDKGKISNSKECKILVLREVLLAGVISQCSSEREKEEVVKDGGDVELLLASD